PVLATRKPQPQVSAKGKDLQPAPRQDCRLDSAAGSADHRRMYLPDLLRGQRILVTGGGTGLGRAMAERLLSLGADVAICGRRKSVCDETAAGWREQFADRRVDTFGLDIRD